MKKIVSAFVLVVLVAAMSMSASAGSSTVSKMALVTIEASADASASPAAVWTALTDPDKAQSWCPYWKDAQNAMPLSSVGATISYEDEYGNAGQSVVLYADAGKELRLAHVPSDGSYMCQVKIQLTPKGSGTTIHVTEQYSDALDVPLDKDTAAASKKSIDTYLAALVRVADGK